MLPIFVVYDKAMRSSFMMVGSESDIDPSLILMLTGVACTLVGVGIAVFVLSKARYRRTGWVGPLFFFGLGAGLIVVGLLLKIEF